MSAERSLSQSLGIALAFLLLILAAMWSAPATAGSRQPGRQVQQVEARREVADNPQARARGDAAEELRTQMRAANAAEQQARSAWAAVVVSGMALVLLIWTLFETRRTANAAIFSAGEAQRAAEAAERSAALQSVAIARQLRPYVAFTEKEDDDQSEPYSKNSSIQVYVRNYGQTPAEDAMFMSGLELRARPIGAAPIAISPTGQSFGKLAPGHSRWIYFGFGGLSTADIASIKSGKEVLLMRFRIEYEVPGGGRDFDEMTIYIDKSGWERGAYHLLSDKYREGV